MNTLAVIVADSAGPDFSPLSVPGSPAALPVANSFRLIDFVLSNCLHSGLRRIIVLTEAGAHSLQRYLHATWSHLDSSSNEFLLTLSPRQEEDGDESQGDADAVQRNLDYILSVRSECILVLAANQIYTMDYRPLIDFHFNHGADVTAAAFAVAPGEAANYDIFEVDQQARVLNLQERPEEFKPLDPEMPPLASMGVYLFNDDVLRNLMHDDAEDPGSRHSFAHDLLPAMVWHERLCAYRVPCGRAPFYWREVSSIDAYWSAAMDLMAQPPKLTLDDPQWPIGAAAAGPIAAVEGGFDPPAFDDALLSATSHAAHARVRRSLLAPGVRVGARANIDDSVLLDETEVGQHCRLRRVVTERGVRIPAGTAIGLDAERDRRWFHVTPGGITVVSAEGMESYLRRSRAPGAKTRRLASQSADRPSGQPVLASPSLSSPDRM